jgi:hypothetical protein
MNRIVVRYSDGRVHKGFTGDFVPTKNLFHLISAKDPTKQLAVQVSALKAIFFVKDFKGNPARLDKPGVHPSLTQRGKQLKITFRDGEVFYGMSEGFHPDAIGFFILPGDMECNIVRAFIVNAFVEHTEIL